MNKQEKEALTISLMKVIDSDNVIANVALDYIEKQILNYAARTNELKILIKGWLNNKSIYPLGLDKNTFYLQLVEIIKTHTPEDKNQVKQLDLFPQEKTNTK